MNNLEIKILRILRYVLICCIIIFIVLSITLSIHQPIFSKDVRTYHLIIPGEKSLGESMEWWPLFYNKG
jgi:hypothetical protein